MLFPFQRLKPHPTHAFYSKLKLNYGLFAPWPRPSPVAPDRLPPTALSVPAEEIREFRETIVARYQRTLRSVWKSALFWGRKHRGLAEVSDLEFVELLCDSPFSRFLNPQLDEVDQEVFNTYLNKDGGQFFKIDFSAMSRVRLQPGVYCAPTVTLIQRNPSNGEFEALAIQVSPQFSKEGLLLTPKDSHAWNQAKYFVLQGAANLLIGLDHPKIHFPANAINAVSKSILPQDHLLFKLLKPHLWLQLPLDFAVLYHKRSVGHNHQKELYTPFPGDMETFYELIAAGYQGIDGNSSYLKYRFLMQPPAFPSDYGIFLKEYFECIYRFVGTIVAKIDPGDERVRAWAKHIAAFVPGFPGENEIFEGDQLACAVTSFIFSVSVFHSADHHAYSGGSIRQVPLRLRLPPPSAKTVPAWNPKRALKKKDLFRQSLAREMFFKDHPISRLIEVDYGFAKAELRQANRAFIEDLYRTEAGLRVRRYIPVSEMACSIQY